MNEAFRKFLIEGEQAGMRYSLAEPAGMTSLRSGLHLGRQAGASLEFREHRDYQPGDDLRRVDWNAYARSDRLTVKQYREEISPHLDIMLDASRSMALAGSKKARAALGLAAVLAIAAENAGFTHNGWLAAKHCLPIGNGKGRPSTWESIAFDFDGASADAILHGASRFCRMGLRVLLSDLFWMTDPSRVLQSLSQGAAGVFVLQVLARNDATPPDRGRLRLIDSETGEERELFLDDAALARYRDALERHRQNWLRAAKQAGASFLTLIAEDLVSDWNLKMLLEAKILKA
jgi:uncharacterized protein (DUF58 family)